MPRNPLIGLVFVTALISSADAADLYQFGGGFEPVTAWTGFYVGINGGYGWSAENSTVYAEADTSTSGFRQTLYTTDTSPIRSFEKSGGFGGGQIGYNLQWDRFVYGVETDIQGADIRGKSSAFVTETQQSPGGSVFAGSVSASTYRESQLDWFGTVRGRLGYTLDQALIYGTGGFAYGGVSGRASTTLDVDSGFGSSSYTYAVNTGATKTGYALGGGVEYALTPLWTLKGEYQYIDFGSAGGSVWYHTTEDTARGYYRIQQNFNTARLGLNYRVQEVVEPLK